MGRVRSNLPELTDVRIARIASSYGIHPQQARQLVNDGWDELFEEVAKNKDLAGAAARTLLSTLPELERQGVDMSKLDEGVLREVFHVAVGRPLRQGGGARHPHVEG